MGLAALGLLGKTADLGGALIYQHALAVTLPEPVAPEMPAGEVSDGAPSPTDESARDRLVTAEDGSLTWRPAPEDSEALGTVLIAAPASDIGSVSARGPDGDGLRIAVDRPATLLLPGTFGDVRVEAEIELLDFEGSIGLVHHYQEAGDRGAFATSTEGDAILDEVRHGDRTLLDEQAFEVPAGRFVLAVSAAGRHLKGLVDGKTVTHGHMAPGPEGSCGLLLAGTGTLRLLRMTVQPLEPH